MANKIEVGRPVLLVIGTVASGFTFVGPFPNHVEAQEYGFKHKRELLDWCVVPLAVPDRSQLPTPTFSEVMSKLEEVKKSFEASFVNPVWMLRQCRRDSEYADVCKTHNRSIWKCVEAAAQHGREVGDVQTSNEA